jgi:hypothetical protein
MSNCQSCCPKPGRRFKNPETAGREKTKTAFNKRKNKKALRKA